MSSFLFGQFSGSNASSPLSHGQRIVDLQTLEQARQVIEGGRETLAPETQNQLAQAILDAEYATPPSSQSKMDLLLEGLLGIIPLEGLAVWVIATEAFAKLTPAQASEGDAAAIITISDPDALKIAIVAAMAVSIISFLLGRRDGNESSASKNRSLWVALIPPAAVFLWAYVVNPSILRTAMGRPEPDARWIAAVAAGFVLILLAGYVGLSKGKTSETKDVESLAPAA